jgi:hypothetical protein
LFHKTGSFFNNRDHPVMAVMAVMNHSRAMMNDDIALKKYEYVTCVAADRQTKRDSSDYDHELN